VISYFFLNLFDFLWILEDVRFIWIKSNKIKRKPTNITLLNGLHSGRLKWCTGAADLLAGPHGGLERPATRLMSSAHRAEDTSTASTDLLADEKSAERLWNVQHVSADPPTYSSSSGPYHNNMSMARRVARSVRRRWSPTTVSGDGG
jgi:hypothetical protein